MTGTICQPRLRSRHSAFHADAGRRGPEKCPESAAFPGGAFVKEDVRAGVGDGDEGVEAAEDVLGSGIIGLFSLFFGFEFVGFGLARRRA